MQKFTRFADKATGINPFLPEPLNGKRILQAVLLLPLGLVRLILFSLTMGILLLHNKACSLLAPFSILNYFRRFLECFGNLCLGRLALLISGFWFISVSASPFSHEPKLRTNSGTVVFVNCQSPFDIVYLLFRLSPRFLRLIRFKKQPKRFLYVQLSILQIFLALFQRAPFLPIEINEPEQLTHVTGVKLSLQRHIEQSRQSINGPVVVFYQGVPTLCNGEYLLAPDYASLAISINRSRFVFNLSYRSTWFPLANTARHPLLHLLLAFMNLRNQLLLDSAQFVLQTNAQPIERCFLDFANPYQISFLKLTYKDYQDFIEMYRESPRLKPE